MKKIFNIPFLLFCALNLSFAQGDLQFEQFNQFIPQSPEAASLGKFGDVPVGHYTGIPNVSVPIYTIKYHDIRIPIALQYSSNGQKIAEEATWVGLGWNLNTGGGMISRTIKGVNDYSNGGTGPESCFDEYGYEKLVDGSSYPGTFVMPQFFKNTDHDIRWDLPYNYDPTLSSDRLTHAGESRRCRLNRNGTIDYTNVNPWVYDCGIVDKNGSPIINSYYKQCNEGSVLNPRYDTEPDVYTFNMNGISGRFVMNIHGNFVSIDDKNFRITGGSTRETFVITAPDGFKYYFGGTDNDGDLLLQYNTTNSVAEDCKERTLTGWMLQTIESPMGFRVRYNYDLDATDIGPTYSYSITEERVVGASIDISGSNNCGPFVLSSLPSVTTNPIKVHRTSYTNIHLESIIFGNDEVRFETSSRIDVPHEKKLDEVEVYHEGSLFNRHKFHYEYFELNRGQNGLHWRNTTVNTQESDWDNNKLKLNRVQNLGINVYNSAIVVPEYSFTYYENRFKMFAKTYKGMDFWGYNNGAINTTLLPPYNGVVAWESVLDGDYPAFLFVTEYDGYKSVNIEGGVRTPNSEFGLMTLLKEVKYPTGGYSTFEYEPNTYRDRVCVSETPENLVLLDADNLNHSTALNPRTGSMDNWVWSKSFSANEPISINLDFLVDYTKYTTGQPCGSPTNWPLCLRVDDGTRSLQTGNGEFSGGFIVRIIDQNGNPIRTYGTRDKLTGQPGQPTPVTTSTNSDFLYDDANFDFNTFYVENDGCCNYLFPYKPIDPGLSQCLNCKIEVEFIGDYNTSNVSQLKVAINKDEAPSITCNLQNVEGPGLRVSNITDYTTVGNISDGAFKTQTIERNFVYDVDGVATGKIMNDPVVFYGRQDVKFLYGTSGGSAPCSRSGDVVRIFLIRTANSSSALNLASGASYVGYSKVYEYAMNGVNHSGYIESEFVNEDVGHRDVPIQNDIYAIFSVRVSGKYNSDPFNRSGMPRYVNKANGSLLYQKVYDDQDILKSSVVNTYEDGIANGNEHIWGFIKENMLSNDAFSSGNPEQFCQYSFLHGYAHVPRWHRLKQTTEMLDGVTTVTDYQYNTTAAHRNPIEMSRTNAHGTNITKMKYPADLDLGTSPQGWEAMTIAAMQNRNILNIPIETKQYIAENYQVAKPTSTGGGSDGAAARPGTGNSGSGDAAEQQDQSAAANPPPTQFLSAQLTLFDRFSGNILPKEIHTIDVGTPQSGAWGIGIVNDALDYSQYDRKVVFEEYDVNSKLTQLRQEDNTPNALIWGYGIQRVVASVVNAEDDEVAYTSFENPSSKGGWDFLYFDMFTDLDAFSGVQSVNMADETIRIDRDLTGDYVVSFWLKGNGFVTVNGTHYNVAPSDDWKYIEVPLTSFTVTISGDASSTQLLVDELRIFPADAMMRTYVYDNNTKQLTSICDENSICTRYTYDEFQRLRLTKDHKDNIIQRVQYYYYNETE